jgi:hypothetical protein
VPNAASHTWCWALVVGGIMAVDMDKAEAARADAIHARASHRFMVIGFIHVYGKPCRSISNDRDICLQTSRSPLPQRVSDITKTN